MLNGKTVNVKMRRIDLCHLMTACTHLRFDLEADAKEATDDEIRRMRENSAKMWSELHDMLKTQLADFDEKHKDDI